MGACVFLSYVCLGGGAPPPPVGLHTYTASFVLKVAVCLPHALVLRENGCLTLARCRDPRAHVRGAILRSAIAAWYWGHEIEVKSWGGPCAILRVTVTCLSPLSLCLCRV